MDLAAPPAPPPRDATPPRANPAAAAESQPAPDGLTGADLGTLARLVARHRVAYQLLALAALLLALLRPVVTFQPTSHVGNEMPDGLAIGMGSRLGMPGAEVALSASDGLTRLASISEPRIAATGSGLILAAPRVLSVLSLDSGAVMAGLFVASLLAFVGATAAYFLATLRPTAPATPRVAARVALLAALATWTLAFALDGGPRVGWGLIGATCLIALARWLRSYGPAEPPPAPSM